jgi:hypothetical protein
VRFLLLSFLLIWTVAGCGSAPHVDPAPPQYKTFEELKRRLDEVTKTGDGGSSLMGIRESIEELKKVDAAKAALLATDFTRLDLAPTTEQRQQIAKEMVDKL